MMKSVPTAQFALDERSFSWLLMHFVPNIYELNHIRL